MTYALRFLEYCPSVLLARGTPCALIAIPQASRDSEDIEDVIVYSRDLKDIVPPAMLEIVKATVEEWRGLSVIKMNDRLGRMQGWSTGVMRLFEGGVCKETALEDAAREILQTQSVYQIE